MKANGIMARILRSVFAIRDHPGNIGDPVLEAWLGGGRRSASGQIVTSTTAMRVSAVFACERIIGGTLASLPLITYERLRDGGKQRARGYPVYGLLHDQPNREQTSLEFRDFVYQCLLIRGNAYIAIVRNGSGIPLELIPLQPDRIRIFRTPSGVLEYEYSPPIGEKQKWMAGSGDVMHLKGMSLDGVNGISVIEYARESIGMAMASQEYNAMFFGRDAVPRILLTHPGEMDDEAFERFKKRWNESQKAGGTAMLEEGMDVKPIGLTAKDAQWLEGMQFGIEEIARFFQVPLHLLSSNARESSFGTGIETMEIFFVNHTIGFWAKVFEQAVMRDLIPRADRERYFAEFNFDGLLRGDSKTRSEALAIRRQNGIITANEWRAIENQNPIEDGDSTWMPLNYVEVGSVTPPASFSVPRQVRNIRARKEGVLIRRRIEAQYKPLIRDAGERIVRREVNDMKNAVTKYLRNRGLEDFDMFLKDFYKKFPEAIGKIMAPVIRSFAEAIQAAAAEEIGGEVGLTPKMEKFVADYVVNMATRHAISSERQLRKILEAEDPAAAIDQRLDEWDERRPDKIADRETIQAGSAVARMAWILLGIETFVWIAGPKACDLCQELDGKVASVTKSFAAAGDDLGEDDGEMTVEKDRYHPPLHQGCGCSIGPG